MTFTLLPLTNPISVILFLKLPCPLIFTTTAVSPVFKSESFINLVVFFVYIHFLIGHIRPVCSLFKNESILKNTSQIID